MEIWAFEYGKDTPPPPENYKFAHLGIWESGFYLVVIVLLVVCIFRKYK